MCKLDIPNQLKMLSIDDIKRIIDKKTYYSEYQPFICTKEGSIYAYEALARFKYNNKLYPPDMVLSIAHKDIDFFSQVEYLLKQEQFKKRPEDKKIFINFDLHAINGKENINRFIELYSRQKNFVIELVENSYLKINTEKLVEIFKKFNFEFAIDDFLKEDSTVSLFLLSSCDYIKLDKDILYQLKSNQFFHKIVMGIVQFTHSQNKKIILEGVETQEDLEIAKELDIDFVQGYLYKNRFISNENRFL